MGNDLPLRGDSRGGGGVRDTFATFNNFKFKIYHSSIVNCVKINLTGLWKAYTTELLFYMDFKTDSAAQQNFWKGGMQLSIRESKLS